MTAQDPTHSRVQAYGIGCDTDGVPRPMAKLGDVALDLHRLETLIGSERLDAPEGALGRSSLNELISQGNDRVRALEESIDEAVSAGGVPEECLSPVDALRMRPPVTVGDYCDFYASEFHASNIGRILRPGSDPLPAAWRSIPMGYHGRSGTVRVSGSPVRRPSGMIATPDGPAYLPSRRLDVEVEIGWVAGRASTPGHPVTTDDALAHVFGAVIVNDWSARDIQAFEYQPLGPFLGKSFMTSISPWIVPLWKLEPFRVDGPEHGDEVSDHLKSPQPRAFDIHLELSLNGAVVSRPRARHLHWSLEQLVAHVTSNGATLRPGDLLATGTISGPEPQTWGSLMELAWGGDRPIDVAGSKRSWLEDGDDVSIRAWCGEDRTESSTARTESSTARTESSTAHTESSTAKSVDLGIVSSKIEPAVPRR